MTTIELNRFLKAQRFIIDKALDELANGKKKSHWMWFVFPQVPGLGRSSKSEQFAIHGRDEAEAYLDHPILGDRLLKCTELFLDHKDKSSLQILGFPDHLKMKSCMTLFAHCQKKSHVFQEVLDVFYDGEQCSRTLEFLKNG